MEKLVPWLRRSSAVFRPKATRFHSTRSFSSTAQLEDVKCKFWMHEVAPDQLFYSTELSFAMMNLFPLHLDVLVCPRREVTRFSDLTSEEVSDLWISAQKIGEKDGSLAGQTVPHVHIHIVPHVAGDNDKIYDAINENEKELRRTIDNDVQLAGWADAYRRLLSTNLDDSSISLDDSDSDMD